MKRDLLNYRRGDCGCCPGHDKFPDNTYSSRRSKKARHRDRQLENQTVRQIKKRELIKLIGEENEAQT